MNTGKDMAVGNPPFKFMSNVILPDLSDLKDQRVSALEEPGVHGALDFSQSKKVRLKDKFCDRSKMQRAKRQTHDAMGQQRAVEGDVCGHIRPCR